MKRRISDLCRSAPTVFYSLLLFTAGSVVAQADDKRVIGWIERVSITTKGLNMDAKVDTGADFSSVHADRIRYFMRDSVRWVEFTLRDIENREHTLQRPLKRTAKIKKKTRGHQERPVVVLQICIGDARYPAQVNLAQRAHFKYPLLLGRGFLKTRFIVDPGAKYLHQPMCQLGGAAG
jgi:hypothetical protein